MKRVAVVTDCFPSSRAPWKGRSTYQTLRLLAAQCDLRVFYPVPTYPGPLTPASAGHGIDLSWRPPDIDVSCIPFPAIPGLSRRFNGFSIGCRLLPHVSAFSPDLILNFAVYPCGMAAVSIARSPGIPEVLKANGSDLNRMSDPLCAYLTRRTLRRANLVTTVSHDLARTALRLGAPAGHTRAMLNGCDHAVFYPRDRQQSRRELNLPADSPLILYLGRLDVRKDLRELASVRHCLPRS